jgi:hypothetical protein
MAFGGLSKKHKNLSTQRIGRICIYSAFSFNIVTFSWLKLDIKKYLGSANTCNKYSKQVHFFYCKNYKKIFIYNQDLYYLYASALKHKDYKSAFCFKKAIKKGELCWD